MQFNIKLNWRYSLIFDKLVIENEKCFSFTPERWIQLFSIAIIATANLASFAASDREFSNFWPQNIYSPNDDDDDDENLAVYYAPIFHEPIVFAVFSSVAYDKNAMVQLTWAAIRLIIDSYQHNTFKSFFPINKTTQKYAVRSMVTLNTSYWLSMQLMCKWISGLCSHLIHITRK